MNIGFVLDQWERVDQH